MSQADTDNEIPDIDDPFPPRFTPRLFGLDSQATLFEKACKGDRLHHAWLLCGPKGSGKASFAYHMSAALLAAKTPNNFVPISMTGDNAELRLLQGDAHPDFFVMKRRWQAKEEKFPQNISIETLRAVQSGFNLSAARDGWRIGLIDAIDDIRPDVTNALLKMIEEPPDKTLFFIVCHNPGTVLDTIKSRCRKLQFNALAHDVLKQIILDKRPETAPTEAAAAAFLAEGNAARGLQLAAHGGLGLYQDLIGLLGALPQIDIEAIHALAGRFGLRAQADSFDSFAGLFAGWLYRMVRCHQSGTAWQPVFEGELAATQRLQMQMALEPTISLWDKVGQDRREADSLNLDRKQIAIDWMMAARNCFNSAV